MGCNGSGWGGSGCLWIILIIIVLVINSLANYISGRLTKE